MYDGSPVRSGDAVQAVKVSKTFLFRYERNYSKNETIREAFLRSVRHMTSRLDVQVMKDAFDMQLGEVKDYFGRRPRWGENANKVEPLLYLPVNLVDRGRYLRSLGMGEEYLYGVESADVGDADTTMASDTEKEEEEEEPQVLPPPEDDHEAKRLKILQEWAIDSDDSDEDDARLRGVTALNAKILKYFEQKKAQDQLAQIIRGKVKSERHVEMTRKTTYDLSLTSKLTTLVNNDYLDHDQETEKRLYDLLDKKVFKPNARKFKIAGKSRARHPLEFKKAYIFNCLVPEGILDYLATVAKIKDPVTEYLNNSSSVRRKRERKEREAQQRVSNSASAPMVTCD